MTAAPDLLDNQPAAVRVLAEVLTVEMKRWPYPPSNQVLAQRAQVIVDALRQHPSEVNAFLEETTSTRPADPTKALLDGLLDDLDDFRAWLAHQEAGYATHVRIADVRRRLGWTS